MGAPTITYLVEEHLAAQARADLVAMSRLSNDTYVLEGAIDQCDGTYKLYYRRTNISPTHVFCRIIELPSSVITPNMSPGGLPAQKQTGFFNELNEGLKKFLAISDKYDQLRNSETATIKAVTSMTFRGDGINNKFFTKE